MRAARVMSLALRSDVMTPRLAMTIARRRRRLFEFRIGDAVRMVDAEHAFDAADHAADRGADHRADRAGDAVALLKPVRGSARNALRLRGQRRRDACEKYAREYCQSHYPSLLGSHQRAGLAFNVGRMVARLRQLHDRRHALRAGHAGTRRALATTVPIRLVDASEMTRGR